MNEMAALADPLDALPEEVAAHFRATFGSVDVGGVSNKGANGFLVFGRNQITHRQVAVKYYYWGSDPRLHLEPEKLAEIQNDNVITINHAGYADGKWSYFEMPFLENGDLDELIRRGRISLQEALQLTFQVASGLAQIHAAGMVHRDLKPENILLAEDQRAVIADFGSVKMLPEGMDGVPGSGHSIAYRPPESFDGLYGKAGDVYQTGIVLYQLLGGRLPYDPMAWLSKKQRAEFDAQPGAFEKSKYVDSVLEGLIKTGKLLDMNSLPSWVPAATRKIIKKTTNPAVAKRIQTPADLCHALHQHQLSMPNWVEEGNQITLEHAGKCCRARLMNGVWIAEKRVPTGWKQIHTNKAATREEAVVALQIHLKLLKDEHHQGGDARRGGRRTSSPS